jgi:hypothetical protein
MYKLNIVFSISQFRPTGENFLGFEFFSLVWVVSVCLPNFSFLPYLEVD